MATTAYRSFPKRPSGVTEWDREDYEKEDGVSDLNITFELVLNRLLDNRFEV